MKNSFFVFILVFSVQLFGQIEKYKDIKFASPVNIPMILSGNFAELRPNHFHAGIDIKTQSKEGLPIFSIEEGKVVRIKVSTSGYGKVIYIEHPNGFTSVYAHLQKFSPEIQKFIKEKQYERKRFEVDVYPKMGQISVKKGELIGYGGNTGGSGGPHLHFEIRDTKTQNTINPQYFYNVTDNIAPQAFKVVAYPLDDASQVGASELAQEFKVQKDETGRLSVPPIKGFGKIGLGIQTIDKQDFTHNIFGVYKASLLLNGTEIVSYQFDFLDFNNDKYINLFMDYEKYILTNTRVQLLYKKPNNKLPFYQILNNNGMISLEEGSSYTAEIVLEDFSGNKTSVFVPIEAEKQDITEKKPKREGQYLIAEVENHFEKDDFRVFFPANSFYENVTLHMQTKGDTISILPTTYPLQKAYTLSIDGKKRFKEEDYYSVFIAHLVGKNKRPSYVSTIIKDGVFSTKTKFLGRFVLKQDKTKPKITPLNFSSKYNKIKKLPLLKLNIEDDLSGISKYEASINHQWILMEYEPKEKLLFFDLKDISPKQGEKLLFKISVYDNVGNQNSLEIPLVYE